MILPESFVRTVQSVHGDMGRNWLDGLPELIRRCETRWDLRVEGLFPLSFNYVAPVRMSGGTEAVLKLGVPCHEGRTEAAALRLFAGHGAVKVLAAEPGDGILLMERVRPGATLDSIADEAGAAIAAAEVMRKLRIPVPNEETGFPSITDWFRGYERLRRRYGGGTGPLPEPLVVSAEERFASLCRSPGPPMLLHGDLHHGNILSADREPWLAIDPKGVIGEAAYEPCALLMNHVPENEKEAEDTIRLRIRLLSDNLQVDPQRMLTWAFCHAVLSAWWCIEDGVGGMEDRIRLAGYFDQLMTQG